MSKITIYFINLYQKYISPFKTKNTCLFYPTCSEYMKQSIIKNGFIKGFLRGLKRILLCHPLNSSPKVDLP